MKYRLKEQQPNVVELELEKIRKEEQELSKKIYNSLKDAMDIPKSPMAYPELSRQKQRA